MEFLNNLAIGIIDFFQGNLTAILALATILAVVFVYIEWKFNI